jgi:tripartite-type tricarboxylate transporter receptor subunit TctC
VPYKGSAPAHVDLLAGQLHLSFSTIVTTLNFIKTGRLKGLAVTSLTRSPLLPDLPTVAEAALPGFEVLVWQGIVAPGGTARAIVVKLNQEIAKTLHGQQMSEQFARQGLQAVGNSPEAFAAFIKSETEKWGKVIRLTGARVE